MSNRRRPERRDAHGAPVRSPREIWTAIGVVAGVLALTVALLWKFQNDPPASSVVTTPTTVGKSTSTTSSATSTTTKATSSSSTATSSTSAATSSTTAATTSTTKP